MNKIYKLIRFEFRSEFRNLHLLSGLTLYIASSVFVSYLAFRNMIQPLTWNAIFWLLVLFTAINTSARGFTQTNKGKWLYYFTLTKPGDFILAKMTFFSVLQLFFSSFCFGFCSLFLGSFVQDFSLFVVNLILGSIGISAILSLVSSIASKAGSSLTLVAILGFPLLLPLLLLLLRVSKNAIDGLAWSVSYQYLLGILFLDLAVFLLAFLLFPYLWND